MKVPPTYFQIVVGKGESDQGDLVDLSFKGSRSGLALLASVSFTCSSAEVYRAWKNGI